MAATASGFSGKTMFISGASRGIGLAIAKRVAADGANVALVAKTTEPHPKLPGTIYTAAKEIEEAGGHALPIVGDVRDGDSGWLDVVRWTQFAMLEAEERDIGKANVDDALTSADFNVQRFLGVIHGYGKILGLDEKWAYNIVKQVGNYGESFERNLGQGSPLKFGRGVNSLWTKGGAMISPPIASRTQAGCANR